MKNILIKVLLAVTLLLLTAPYIAGNRPDTPAVLTAEKCHTANMFFEARGESKEGMQAVAAVVINRVNAKGYPADVCSVVFQSKQFSWTHQQNVDTIQKILEGDIKHLSNKDRQAYQQANLIAQKSDKELTEVLPKGVTHYHATYVKPQWSKFMKKVKKIGTHVFYRKEGKYN